MGKARTREISHFSPSRTTGRGRDYQDPVSPLSLWVPLVRGAGDTALVTCLAVPLVHTAQPPRAVTRSPRPSDPLRSPSSPIQATLTVPSLSAAPTGPGLLKDGNGPCPAPAPSKARHLAHAGKRDRMCEPLTTAQYLHQIRDL